MSQEIYRDRFGAIRREEGPGILELEWFDDATGMTDEDFKAWLTRYAAAAETTHTLNLVIDVTHFAFRPGPDVGPWRDEHIIPRYNAAGVRKFAFLVPPG